MEHTWMSEEVRGEIEDLRSRYAFEEDEALAFWHLQQAGRLMNEMRSAELQQEIARGEGRDDEVAFLQTIIPNHAARWHSTVSQHFAALRNVLGERVLRRHFPDGWGRQNWREDAEEG
jgi:hypothetical protein